MKKLSKILVSVLLAVVFAISFAACDQTSDNNDDKDVECTDITFRATGYDEGETWYLERGKEVTIVGTVAPANATVKDILWHSDNADISVEKTDRNRAKITAYDYGTANLTAKCGNFEKTIAVECVAAILPTQIIPDSSVMTIPVSERAEFGCTFVPENTTNKRLSFSVESDDASCDAISILEENGKYFVRVASLAEVGSEYTLNVACVADAKVKASVKLVVGALDVESMSLKSQEITLSVNDPIYRITPSFEPEETSYKAVTYSSDNEEVCGVDEIGTLQPKKAGVANITVTNASNEAVKCSMKVNVTEAASEYVTRLIKKSDIDNMTAVDYSLMDFETDKVAFNAWKRVLSEDCNSASHISDAGWAIWMVGFDTYDDDGINGGDANAAVFCKLNVPAAAKSMQYVFRVHPFPDDNAKFKILAIDGNYNVEECTDGWVVMQNNADMFINIDVEKYAGKAVTFAVLQDQIGNKPAGNYMKVSLMFRRVLFDTDTSERWIEDEDYSIIKK